ncbi:hypothetical protein NQZ79_g5418 [Umbelopsis isabellina]|nr:hypothetical protein NQZ79_g5418 [Umbelopsis isabellina]
MDNSQPPEHTIRLTPIVWSSLLYECATSIADQEGFLIGSRIQRTSTSVNDSSDEVVESSEDFTIVRKYHILSRTLERPYNHLGQFDQDLLSNLLEDVDKNEVVGYFRFRRQTLLQLSQRERCMASNLKELLPHCIIFALFTSILASEEGETHSYLCNMWEVIDSPENDGSSGLMKVPIEIVNMMENTLQYRTFISNAATTPSLPLSQIINTASISKQYNAAYQESLEQLQQATDRLMESEYQLKVLRDELDQTEDESEPSNENLDTTMSAASPQATSPTLFDSTNVDSEDMIDLLS